MIYKTIQNNICSVERCSKQVRCKGLCGAHYARVLKHRSPLSHIPLRKSADPGLPPRCCFPKCINLRRTHNAEYCSGHYQQLYKGKELTPLAYRNQYTYTTEQKKDPDFVFYSRQAWARALRKYFDDKCCVCGYDITTHAHHITPISHGGEHSIRNGIILCPNHHNEVHKRLGHLIPEDWLKMSVL